MFVVDGLGCCWGGMTVKLKTSSAVPVKPFKGREGVQAGSQQWLGGGSA